MASYQSLPDRGVVEVRGSDAGRFLQNLVTNNVELLPEGGAGYGALLSPQGKIQFDFLMFRDGERFLIDLPRAMAGDFVRRLGFYRLRLPIEIADLSDRLTVFALWGDDAASARGPLVAFAPDPRNGELGYRGIAEAGTSPTGSEAASSAYELRRISCGVPEGGRDFAYNDAFPHDADIDQLTGIDFKKGCYVGQEVVSRMEHRGTARRRIVQAIGERSLTPGAEIVAGDRAIGVLGSAEGAAGLAMIRIDRAAEAMTVNTPLTAEDVPLTLSIPSWARFTWPTNTEPG